MKSALGALLGCALSGACFATNLNIVDYGATPDNYNDDDAIAINAAINAARDGDVVIIPEGTFHIREMINLKSNVDLKGDGYAKSGIAALYEGEDADDLVIKGRNVTNINISGLRLKSNYSGGVRALISITHSSKITISDSSFHRFKKHGIYFNHTRDGNVKNSKFQDATDLSGGGHGYGVVYTNGCEGGRVDNSYFYGPNIRHGVVIQGDPQYGPSHGIVVKGNYFKETTQDAIDLHGSGEYNNQIMYNTIEGDPAKGGKGQGIGIGENAHKASGSGNVIRNNVIRNTLYGIRVMQGSPGAMIKNNEIYNCKEHGIYIENGIGTEIRGNIIEGCQHWGVFVKDGNNTIIRKGKDENNEDTINQINGNGLSNSTTGFGGIRVKAGNTGVYVLDNDLCENDNYGGVNLSFEGQGTVKNNLCQ
ncbi:right-handed parallel beta-helix repeat-containing protein [Hahella aquimaris]|uniref:right-handed parallel beta-helix repeat-containing protein n=1 Tax=Hahella sp. HNIBRBA332 TaxID=3015983 RepID=UPI00273C4C85|nr:right-handed parallel beta-helix repeat-containing protein [Hahella sp. HNIBRBA332]WLQ11727.1 right-handed parallel beta-helix repeat-containing protein [Hahella sp. HNIBRBA332]